MRYVVAYDVTDDSRRARIAAVCAAFGDRIQLSVFETTLANDEVPDLLRRLGAIADPSQDSIHLIPVCERCHGSRALIGQAYIVEEEPFWIV